MPRRENWRVGVDLGALAKALGIGESDDEKRKRLADEEFADWTRRRDYIDEAQRADWEMKNPFTVAAPTEDPGQMLGRGDNALLSALGGAPVVPNVQTGQVPASEYRQWQPEPAAPPAPWDIQPGTYVMSGSPQLPYPLLGAGLIELGNKRIILAFPLLAELAVCMSKDIDVFAIVRS